MKALALLLVAFSLAGCTQPSGDFSSEMLSITISDRGDGYDVTLPLWLGEGADAQQWVEAFTMTAENGSFELTLVDDQIGLHVWGTGRTTLNAHGVTRHDAPRAFLAGQFSLGSTGERSTAIVHAGDVDVFWSYEATSDGCSMFWNQYWTDVQTGTHLADEGSSGSPPPHCVQ